MSRTMWIIVALLLLLLWLIFGARYVGNRLCGGVAKATTTAAAAAATTAPAVAKKAVANAWIIKDGSGLNLSSPAWVKFKRNGYSHLKHEPSVVNSIDQTAAYLKKNPKRSLTITGMYGTKEKNNSILPDLGMARANNIKNELVAKGVPSTQLALASQLVASRGWSANKDTLREGVAFAFGDLKDNKDRLAAIKKRLFGKPITLYFATGQDNINLSSKQRTDISDLIYYLDNVAKSKLEIAGHTDNVGKKSANTKLSKERAEFAQNYLRSNGISNSRMSAVGFGPDKPIASNDNKEGRAKNRRVEIVLK